MAYETDSSAVNPKSICARVYRDLKFSWEKMASLRDAIREDFKFELGKQWDVEDVDELRRAGVKALTINKIKPIIKLLTGIERQSKSDYKAFPEGGEDQITAEIATRLMKNVVKNSFLEIKFSEVFKNGCIGGMCFLEPYVDYSFDMINGDMKFKKISPLDIFLDPNFKEYDLSDSKFIGKVTWDLSKEDLIALFPKDKAKIEKIENGKLNLDTATTGVVHFQKRDYSRTGSGNSVLTENTPTEACYDLVDYFYKELGTRYFCVISDKGIIEEFEKQSDAEQFNAQFGGVIVERDIPVIMHAQVCGNVELYNGVAWSYPQYRTYPIIPYFAELVTEELDDLSVTIQGVVRGLKDLNLEYNKRRTQELRHLNSSANSGFEIEENQLSKEEEDKLKKFGSSPGIVIKRRQNSPAIGRITPMPLSQGHSQLAAENAQDLKEASGVNPDLLANSSQSQSGRAILLKQRQGLAMIQEMLDNFAITKKIAGKFILSQMPDIFTLESAKKILGSAFVYDNFNVPVNMILDRGLSKIANGYDNEVTKLERETMLKYPQVQEGQPITDESGQLVTAVDTDTADNVIKSVLNNKDLVKYDISVGEGIFSETIRMANFTDLKELAGQGVPIPPQSLIELSMIPESQKKTIMNQLQAQMASQMAPAASPSKPGVNSEMK
jgi:hypothetical protein